MRLVRIWILEDNNADAFLIELALRRTGLEFEKTVISDGEHAIRAIRDCQAGRLRHPHVVLMDLNLPKYDGVELLQAIRETPVFDNTGIAVFSSMPPPEESMEEFGVKRHLQKPADLEEFLTEVSHAVRELLPELK